MFSGYRLDIGDVLFTLEELGRAHAGGAEAVFLGIVLLLPAACWGIAWLRVREAQVSDGV